MGNRKKPKDQDGQYNKIQIIKKKNEIKIKIFKVRLIDVKYN